MNKKGRTRAPRAAAARRFAPALLRGTLLWLVPAAALWLVATPLYNRFLTEAAQNVVRAGEALGDGEAVTRLTTNGRHHFVITRTDRPTSDGTLGSVRVTDIHFPFVLTWCMFLAVPGVTMRRRLERVGWASLLLVFFHIADAVLWVQFTYATQLGPWSLEHYGPVARNLWGLGKHVADLPIKFGLPFALWVTFNWRQLTPTLAADGP